MHILPLLFKEQFAAWLKCHCRAAAKQWRPSHFTNNRGRTVIIIPWPPAREDWQWEGAESLWALQTHSTQHSIRQQAWSGGSGSSPATSAAGTSLPRVLPPGELWRSWPPALLQPCPSCKAAELYGPGARSGGSKGTAAFPGGCCTPTAIETFS